MSYVVVMIFIFFQQEAAGIATVATDFVSSCSERVLKASLSTSLSNLLLFINNFITPFNLDYGAVKLIPTAL